MNSSSKEYGGTPLHRGGRRNAVAEEGSGGGVERERNLERDVFILEGQRSA